MNIRSPTIRHHVTSGATGGAFELTEYTVPSYFPGPTCHWHAQTTVTWYVLDGMLAFTLDDRTIMAPRGTCVMIPPRMPHTFFNPTAEPATLLLWCAPGGVEGCCAELT